MSGLKLWLQNYKIAKISQNLTNFDFTCLVVINAFKRDEQLKHVLKKLNGLRFLRYVIVLWADVERKPPPADFWPQIHVPVHFVLTRNNSLNERFLPYDMIETEAVFVSLKFLIHLNNFSRAWTTTSKQLTVKLSLHSGKHLILFQ